MTALLSIVTPVAPYHLHLQDRVLQQVSAQSVPCLPVLQIDSEGRGAGWARNRAAARVETPFIAFLDADDLITPDYAARMLQSWERGFYVYSDWVMFGEVQQMTPYGGLWNGLHHLVNCLMLTADFRQMGGFNEAIEAEDTEFWLRCNMRGLCGKRCPYPLIDYMDEGRRSAIAQQKPGFSKMLTDYYRSNPPIMCTGCDGVPSQPAPVGDQQPGDVLVLTLWGGNQTRVGRVTGRAYLRSGNGKTAWVNRADAEAAPEWYRIIDAFVPADVTLPQRASMKTVLDKLPPDEEEDGAPKKRRK